MRKENLYQPFEIEVKELSYFPKASRRNNFFELIYISSGTGVQYVNQHRFNYRKGNLFLITPQDTYSFEITATTCFFFLRFNEYYVKSSTGSDHQLAQRMDYILLNASHRPGCILKNKVDKPLIASLIESVMQEQMNQQIYSETIITQIVNTIITVVARNIALKLPKNIKEDTGEVVLEILHYIQQHIFDSRQLKAEKLAGHFGVSMSYLGKYFKKQTGDTLQQYIAMYKVRLIEMRLLHSDMRVNEIVNELNFTDESHLNKIFKKYKGLSPTEFKKHFLKKSSAETI